MRTDFPRLRLVVFDLAGTTLDHGSFAPVAPFIETFARHGVQITVEQARGPMGLHKRDHIRALLQIPAIASSWREARGRDWTEDDVADLYTNHFMKLQLEEAQRHSRLVPGLLDCLAYLRERGIKTATTTGYFRAALDVVKAAAQEQGFRPDGWGCPEDVSTGRPAPWMIFRHMEELNVYPPAAVLKVGDTVPDIEEGRNAGTWSIGVTRTGSEVGCTEAEFAALAPAERNVRTESARRKLLAAGAHAVIESVADLPGLVCEIDERLRCGERP